MLEEAKSIGDLLKTGWKPRSYFGLLCMGWMKNLALLGSTEWVEEHEKELQQKAVVYINSDNNERGFLFAEGSHALEPLMDEIAKSVIDPQTGASVFERAKANEAISTTNTEAREKILAQDHLKLYAMGSVCS